MKWLESYMKWLVLENVSSVITDETNKFNCGMPNTILSDTGHNPLLLRL